MTDKPFVLLVVGDIHDRQTRMIAFLQEKYGDKLKVINQPEFEEIQGVISTS